jgi:uncharacterized membrane protein
MSDLVVLTFDSENTADRVRDKLLQLQNQQLVMLDDLVVVVRHADGKPEIKQSKNLANGAGLGGAFWGLLIGVLFLSPFLGAAIGSALGAVLGHYRDLRVDDKFMMEVGTSLKPGTSSVFLLIHQVTPDRVVSQLQEFHPKMMTTNITHEQEEKLRAAFVENTGLPIEHEVAIAVKSEN